MNSSRRIIAEFVGTIALLTVVVGSGIMAERLSAGNMAVALLANALATGFALYVLISILGPVSGAHFNPVVTLVEMVLKRMSGREACCYWIAQWGGAVTGVWLAHAMFDLPLLQTSQHVRTGIGQWLSEIVATVGLLLTILGMARDKPAQIPAAVGAYIAAAYWFTASTSFANPAVTTARMLTDTFAGIRPADAPGFMAAQLLGTLLALGVCRLLWPAAGPQDKSP